MHMMKKKESVEFRYYDVPQGETVLALLGESWNRVYGHDAEGIHIHFHNLMEIGVCLRGEGEMVLGERREQYTDGMFTLIPANYLHTTISSGEEKNAWEYLFFDPEAMARDMAPGDPAEQRALLYWLGRDAWLLRPEAAPQLASLLRLILEEMRGRGPYYRPAVQQMTQALALLIMRWNREMYSENSEGGARESLRILPVFDYVNTHYAEPLRVGDLARACSMSETHVRRLFEEIMHMSPTEYLNLVRVQQACELLKRTDDPLDLIAARCGFGNVSTLNRNFKKLIGVTPYQWKKLPDNYERGLMQFHVTAIRGWQS